MSFGLSVSLILLVLYLSNLVGFFQPPLITYQSIVGGGIDRADVFNTQRTTRKLFDFRRGLAIQNMSRLKRKSNKYALEPVQEDGGGDDMREDEEESALL